MPLSLMLLALLVTLAFSSFAESDVMVEAEGDREKVLARGPRCVSFSSMSTKPVSKTPERLEKRTNLPNIGTKDYVANPAVGHECQDMGRRTRVMKWWHVTYFW
jgi:hypothetical protein